MAEKVSRYFKLAPHAFSFSDSVSGISIRPDDLVEIENTSAVQQSKRLKIALGNGHVIEIQKSELDKGKETVKLTPPTTIITDPDEKEKKKLRKKIKDSELPAGEKKKLGEKSLEELKAIVAKIPKSKK